MTSLLRTTILVLVFLLTASSIRAAERIVSPEGVVALRASREVAKTDTAKAEKILRDQLAKDKEAALLFELGVVLAQQKKTEQAIRLFRDVVKADPSYPQAKANLGQLLALAGKNRDAVQVLTDVVKTDGITAQRCLLLGRAYMALNDPESAENCLRVALVGYPNDSRVLLSLAVALYRQEQFRACEATCRKVLRSDPSNAAAWGLMANSRMLDKRPEEAVDALEAATRLNAEGDVNYLWSLGDLYLQLGLPAQAKRAYAAAGKRGKPDSKRTLALARTFMMLDDLDAAQSTVTPLTKGSPSGEVYLVLGQIARRRNKDEEAAAHLRRALELAPMLGEAVVALGDIELAAGKHDKAIARYRSARTIGGWARVAMEAEADAYLRQDRLADAAKVLREMKRKFDSRDWDELIVEIERRLERQ